MTSLASRLLDFLDERLDHMLEAPSMWGAGESVELQILQLLEVRALILAPAHAAGWRAVQPEYERFLARQFPGSPPTTLSVRLGARQDQLTAVLGQFIEAQRAAYARSDDERNADEIRTVEGLLELGRRAAGRVSGRRDTHGDRLVRLGELPR